MKAMILAAGLGSRLHPLTIDRTKPAIPFLGKPLVRYVAEYLRDQGLKDLVVNLHHQADSVRRSLENISSEGISIHYSEEFPEILGTAGAFRQARGLLGDDAFLAINGKIITDIDLAAAIRSHQASGAIATMVVIPNRDRSRFTEILVNESRVVGFGGFPSERHDNSKEPLLWTGIQILNPEVFDFIPEGEQDIVSVFYRVALDRGIQINAHIADGIWNEMSTIARYLDASIEMMGDQPYYAGADCVISRESSVTESVIWDRVTIGDRVRLRRVVLGDDVVIPSGSSFEDCAIVSANAVHFNNDIPAKATAGMFHGNLYVVPIEKG